MGSITPEYDDFKRKTRSVKETLKFVGYIKACALTQNVVRHAREEIMTAFLIGKAIDCELMVQEMYKILFDYGPRLYSEEYRDGLPGCVKFICPPKVEGAEHYNFNLKAKNSEGSREFDTIKISVGVDYKGCYFNYVHTLLINPTEKIKDNFNFLLQVFKVIVNNLKDGVQLSEVYESAISFAENENRHLAKHLKRPLGFALNPFSPDDLVINSNTMSIVQYDMIFSIDVELIGLREGKRRYNLCSSNTVRVRHNQYAEVLTHQQDLFDSVDS